MRRGPRVFATGGPFDGTRIFYSGGVGLASDQQLTLELQKTVQLGFDLIKTYVRLDDRLQKRVIEFAHANGMPVPASWRSLAMKRRRCSRNRTATGLMSHFSRCMWPGFAL